MLIFYIALAMAGFGQQPGKPGKKESAPASGAGYNHLDNTLLWKISGNGLTRSSYLFGTMHVLCADDATVSDTLKLAIKYCDRIYFELDMDNMAEMLGAMKYLRMNDGKKLSELLTKEEYAKVEMYFKNNAVPLPLAMMNRFKPYFISSLIGEQMMNCSQ
jgi:uncharacterized protein YbaP (TraB family)